jgi:hypothetical protein
VVTAPIWLGKHSVRAGFAAHLKAMGIQVSADQLRASTTPSSRWRTEEVVLRPTTSSSC